MNPSELLLKSLHGMPQVDTLLLPVSFNEAFERLQQHLQRQSPYDALLLLGQAGGRSKISLERIAINWRESKSADNSGLAADPGHLIQTQGENAYFSTLPLEEMKQALEALQIPVEISFSAGAYVCNDLFYRAAAHFAKSSTSCGFIHVPYLPEQTVNKPNAPSMPLIQMERAVKTLIACVFQQPRA